tara:strand:+ start:200 stop:370 length:171 start_codon:yes stop_codon:yes gene_type:complete
VKGITPSDAVFIAQWSLRSDKQRIKDEIKRRKNMALTSYRIDEAIRRYKEETGWDE